VMPFAAAHESVVALRDTRQHLRFAVGIGWTADIEEWAASAESDVIDPKRASAKCTHCDATLRASKGEN
jgi:hypothetical protein